MKLTLSKWPVWVIAAAAAALLMLLLAEGGGTETASRQEKRIAEVLSAIAGAGRVEVVLFYPQEDTGLAVSAGIVPTGALVVAEGAGNMGVRLDLIRAVRTLLGLSENAVDVFVMEGET